MKLWLDDVRPPPDESWTWVKDVVHAQSAVNRMLRGSRYTGEVWEIASLDHDLGMGDRLDGIAFVDWMVRRNKWPKTKPTVHSMNPPGRERMQATIDRYWRAPEDDEIVKGFYLPVFMRVEGRFVTWDHKNHEVDAAARAWLREFSATIIYEENKGK